jgi:hypothetical protein
LADERVPGLESESVHDRVEAIKKMGLESSVDELDLLIELSQDDASPAVRLRAAEAASDILSRHRIGEARALLSVNRRRQFLDQFRRVDPFSNPGLFPFLACLDLPRCLSRIIVGLRDPRYDVRLGAVLALRRYCCSWSVSGEDFARKKLVQAFSDSRLKPDVLASLSELVAACGWQEAREALGKLLGREDQAGFAAEAAIEVLDQLASIDGLQGIWASNGLDAGEVSAQPRPLAWFVLSPEKGFLFTAGEKATAFKWSNLGPTSIQVTEGRTKSEWSLRRLWLSEKGDDDFGPAIQMVERTFYRVGAEAVGDLVGALETTKGIKKPVRIKCAEVLLMQLSEGVDDQLLAARIERSAGQSGEAAERLKALIKGSQKAKIEWSFWMGEALLDAKKGAAGKKALKHYLDKAAKKAPHRKAAEALLKGA